MKRYIADLGVDLNKWKDIPAKFREMVEEVLKTKSNKKWTYLVNVALDTIFWDFVEKYDGILPRARIHVADGYWQDQTFSMLFEQGSVVPYSLF